MSKVRRKRTSSEQQYRYLMECRSSGLSDQQWCREKGIEPSTFYNWVSRLRKQGTYDIPEPCHAWEFTPAPIQDVVKLDIFPEKSYDFPSPQSPQHQNQNNALSTIEISLGDTTIRISNEADPLLLTQVMRCLGHASC